MATFLYKHSPCLECKVEKKAAVKYRWTLVFCLAWPFALGALDSTIIATALPWIAGDFGQVSQLNWIVSAFNLTSAAFIPFWAQMADVFGRNTSLNSAIILMLIGSALCTGAPTNAFPVLLLGRGFQGISAAGINVNIRTILADKVSLQENAQNWAIFSMVGGASHAVGPVIGGYLTSADWRWCFAINLPVAAVALIVIFFFLRKELLGPQPLPELHETAETGRRSKFSARLKTIDFGGQILFIVGFGLIILALTWGGATYSWASAAVIIPLVLGCVFTGCFVYWEFLLVPGKPLAKRMPWQKAMLPWELLSDRDIGLLFYCECTTGMGMYAVLYFCNIYFIAVRGYDSDKAGIQLLYFLPGLAAGAIGIGLLGWAIYAERLGPIYGMMALVGCGSGMRFMASPLHGIGLFKNLRASVIALMAVAIPFGGTLGLTIMSSVFNNTSGLDSKESDFSQIQSQPEDVRDEAIHKAKMGVVWAFVSITPFVVMAVVCAACLGNVKFNQGPVGEDGNPTDMVVRGSYLLSLMRTEKKYDEEAEGIRLESSQGLTLIETTPLHYLATLAPVLDLSTVTVTARIGMEFISDYGSEEEQSPNPRFWLEFRTFDDGLSSPAAGTTVKPTLTAFPQFAMLPPELRLRIWSCLIQPRVVVACCLQCDERLPERRQELDSRTHGDSVPVVLQVNRESRYLALQHYELSFSWRISKLLSDTPISRPARVWFNFALDTIYLTGELEAYDSYGFNSPMVYFLQRKDTRRVRHVACAFSELGYPQQESDQIFGCLWHVVDGFTSVERLLLTVDDGDQEDLRGNLERLAGWLDEDGRQANGVDKGGGFGGLCRESLRR
ncbi:major facilitator superfamily domain-containing protein [Dactylonectria macrodidyma]|uniref:Major facilitator superfamily domain-containing protein n=1 Tax=Dactylonectria macrodidyma TaxID=307937 RepID=A0A9P9F991_9HYPO|nr:major facilitator superfamily domain-containing protein [Dactylonectria macrodidyma]